MAKLIYFFITFFCFSLDESLASNQYTSWSLPTNYPELAAKARQGDILAQEKISGFIYQGIIRYPKHENKEEREFFNWLNDIPPKSSFTRKVACFFFKEGQVENAQEIYNEIKAHAEKGDIYAQRSLGSCQFHTDKREDNRSAAIEWYRKAAEKGHARAQMSLALRYLHGIHTEKDISEGMKWLQMAAKAGLPEAQATLADFYLRGENVYKDINKGYALILAAAKGGDTHAQTLLALHHLNIFNMEFPVKSQSKEGIKWLKIACNSGDLQAMYFYGACLIMGRYMEKNEKEGIELLTRAADSGHKDSQLFLKKFLED